MNRYDMQQPQYPQNRGYQPRPPGGNIPRQHPPQHHMGQQQPQHQGQPQANQQQSRPVLPQMAQQFHYGHPQQPVYVASYAPQIAAQNMSAAGQSVTYPRVYYPYPAQQFQPIQAWNQMTLPQAQQPGMPQAYYQATLPTQVATAQQMQAAQHQYYAQQAGAAFVRGVGITTAPQQPMQIQHQQNHPGHHAHPPQHVQPTPGVQGTQAPPPQAPDSRENVAPSAPRERKVLKIINPDTGESVIESPPVPATPPVEEPAAQTAATTTTTDEVNSTPQHVVPAVVVQANNQPGEDIVVKPAEEEPAFPRSNARAEFFQKISQSAEEDRPISEATSPSPNSTTPMPTTSTTSGGTVEPEVSSAATPSQTPQVVSIDNEVKEERQPQPELDVEEDENPDTTLDTTPNNFDEPSLADISSVSIDNYIDDTPEKPMAPVEPAQPSTAVITKESESLAPESLVKEDTHAPTPPVVTPPQEVPVVPTSTPTPTPVQETETVAPVNHIEKLEETTDLTDVTMQNKNLDKEILQNGDQVTEEEDEVDDDEAPESVEEGEIVDGSGEEPEEQGKKKRIRYDRDTLLGFKAVASKDALPDMNSIPPEVIKVPGSGSNHFKGSPSPNNFPLPRMGPYGGAGRFRNDRGMGPPGMHGMGGMVGMGMKVPPPPPVGRQPPRVIELSREEVKLHKAENAWKPTPVKSRTRGGKTEDKDEDEIIKDEIVKKTRGILNKLTPENFDKLVIAFLDLNLEDKDDRIAAVIYVVFEKAIDEPSFSTAYANMVKTVCDKSQLTAKKFRKNILDQCQKEFQKGSTAEEEIKALEESLATAEEDKKEELKLELADKKYASRRRSLGNVRFIGELYKLQMLTPKIMIDCVNILLANHDEESFESLCKLLTTIGQRLDNQLKELEAKATAALRANPPTPVKFSPPEKYMDKTFDNLRSLSHDTKLSSRIRFALLDVIELRECSWKPRRDADGPKKIGEVHRDAIRQQQEEKIQLQNLPPQGPPMRPGSMPQKKMNDWSTVPSNKSSRFQVKKPTGASSGQESSPMLAPNRGGSGSWNPSGSGGQLPPRNNQFIPPRLQTQQSQGRFGVLSQEDRAPPPTPLRENIVQAPPPPLRTQGSRESSRPQTPTRDQPPLRPEPNKAPTPPPKDVAPINIGESVKNIFEEFMSTSNWEDVVYYMRDTFPGDRIVDFVDQLSRQVSEMSKEVHEKGAGALVKGLIKRSLISKAQVIKVFTEGLMMDLPDIEVDVPKVTSYVGVFLVELFLDEPDLSWLLPLGESIEEQEPTVWGNLVTNTLNFLKLRLSEEAVQVLYKKTEHADRLPVEDLPWIAGESVETLSKKMLLVLEKEKDSANISDSFKENSWDLREELTSKSLTEAICQISWKAAGGWDVPVLQKLLPQLITASPKLHPQLWNQAKEFIKRNSIRGDAEEELWEEMHKLKLTSRESVGQPSY